MEVRRHPDAASFLADAGPFLRRQPVLNQLPLGIAQAVQRKPTAFGGELRFYAAYDGTGAVLGALVQTLPWPALLSVMSSDVAAGLGAHFATHHAPLRGITGMNRLAYDFADEYCLGARATFEVDHALGVFELTAVNDSPRPPGRLGRMVPADLRHAPILQAWLTGFRDEAVPTDPDLPPTAGETAAASGRYFVWLDENEAPVCLAGSTREVERWASIGPVYTPPEARSRGYAGALVAALSRHLLAQGRPGCTLFTNLANPTSNALYERIGFRRIADGCRLLFQHPV